MNCISQSHKEVFDVAVARLSVHPFCVSDGNGKGVLGDLKTRKGTYPIFGAKPSTSCKTLMTEIVLFTFKE